MPLLVTVAHPQVCDSRVSTPRMELDMIDKACKSDAPAVMLVSQQDCVVVFELQRRVMDACRGFVQHLILPEADHGQAR